MLINVVMAAVVTLAFIAAPLVGFVLMAAGGPDPAALSPVFQGSCVVIAGTLIARAIENRGQRPD